MIKKVPKQLIYVLIAAVVVVGLLVAASYNEKKPAQVPLSQLIEQTSGGQVEKIEVVGDQLNVTLKNGEKETSYKEKSASLKDYGLDYTKVVVEVKNPDDGSSRWFDIILGILPIVIIIGFFYFIMRQAQGSNNQAMSFGKSKARVFGLEKEKVKFTDVAGSIEAKTELQEIVEFLKYPSKF